MEISELKSIIEKSGLSAYKIEKDLKITNGTLGKVLKGEKVLPEKYEEPLRFLAKEAPRDNPLINSARGRDESGVNEDEATLEIEEQEVPVSANNYAAEPEVGEVDLNEYEKIESDGDKFVGEVMDGEEISLNVDGLPKMNINDLDFGNIQLVTKKKQVKRPLMDIADLL